MKEVLEELLKKQQKLLNDFFGQIDLINLSQILETLLSCQGLIVLTGIGKSGLIAKKIAVTMTSTGTRAIYLSPTNAMHGDLGILKPDDIFIVLSKSGETDELLNLIPYVRNRGVKIIAVVSNPSSRLAKAVHEVLTLPEEKELCPYDLAPTTSTTIQLIIGDILAIALMLRKNITAVEFAISHPAGRLGKRIFLKVSDLMLKNQHVPSCSPADKLVDILVELSNKQCGCVLVKDSENKLIGIFTDGDLRRSLQEKGAAALDVPMTHLMNPSPRTAAPDMLAWEAMKSMEANQNRPITVLPVIAEDRTILGIIKLHDIIQSGI